MAYYFSKIVDLDFEEAKQRATERLAEAGFGVLTEIDVSGTMKKKLDRDMPPYHILGACNPGFAWKALEAEDKIGTMLPCNVIVRQDQEGRIEVAAVDPIASMAAIDNPALGEVAKQVQGQLKDVIEAI